MSLAASPIRFLTCVVVWALLSLDPAAAFTRVVDDGTWIRLEVPILIVDQTADGLPADLLAQWAEEIHETWSWRPDSPTDEPWVFCGRKVDVQATFELVDGDVSSDREGWNLVAVSDRTTSFTTALDEPRAENGEGRWSVTPDWFEIAHEVGHFLGLHDEYQTVELPDGSTRNEPLSDEAARSLMGSFTGVVQPRNVAEMLAQHGIGPCDLLIEIDETLETGVASDLEHYHWKLANRYEVVLVEDGTGHYTTASFDAEGHRFWNLGDGCDVAQGRVGQKFEAQEAGGERLRGDTITLAIEAVVIDTKSFDARVACDGAAFGGEVPPMSITNRFEIDGVLDNGRLQKQERDVFDVLTLERRISVRQIDGR